MLKNEKEKGRKVYTIVVKLIGLETKERETKKEQAENRKILYM